MLTEGLRSAMKLDRNVRIVSDSLYHAASNSPLLPHTFQGQQRMPP